MPRKIAVGKSHGRNPQDHMSIYAREWWVRFYSLRGSLTRQAKIVRSTLNFGK